MQKAIRMTRRLLQVRRMPEKQRSNVSRKLSRTLWQGPSVCRCQTGQIPITRSLVSEKMLRRS
jgi:hypothetical protein